MDEKTPQPQFISTPIDTLPAQAPQIPPGFSERLMNPKSHRLLKYLILAAIFLFIASVLLLVFSTPSFSEKDVVVTLTGPDQAHSGDEVTYALKYENKTKLTLHNLSFRFFYPDGSMVNQNGHIIPVPSEGFIIDTLNAGESGEREFKAFLVGDKGDIKQAKIQLIFSAGSLQSSFEKSATVSTTITGLPIPLTLVAPPSAVSGQQISYILDYRNESDADISDLMFEFTLPDGFTVQQTSPKPASGTTWSVATLKQGSGSRITITGTLTGQEREAKTIQVVLRRNVNGQYIDYEKASSSTIISSPLLGLSMTVNGAPDYVAHAGDTLKYVIAYRNTSKQTLIGLTLSVKLEGTLYDFATVDPSPGFFNGATNTVQYSASGVPQLASLGPNQSGQVQFGVRLKSSLGGLPGTRNFSVKATATLATPNVPTGIDAQEISTQTSIVTKVSIDPTLAQPIYYNDPATGPSGPMPPQVGQTTVFTVHWKITNPGNDASGTKITATLAPGVTWKNITSTTSGLPLPVYNKNNAQVTWDVGTVPTGTGVTNAAYEASFQISITPSVNQRGQTVPLITNTTLAGTDSFTRQSIVVHVRDMSTSDIIDRPDEGTVQ